MIRLLLALLTVLALPSVLKAAPAPLPQIVNVSSYDPKEKQRAGRSYSEHDVSALRDNGASGLIARAGKGGNLDTKCSAFLAAADRVGLWPGVYYRVQRHVDPVQQADQFVNRVAALSRSRDWNAPSLLLCGDYDGDLHLSSILAFMDRVEARTGVIPVAYLENSPQLKLQTRSADRATRARLARAPYWLALYSHESGAGAIFPAPGSPEGLTARKAISSIAAINGAAAIMASRRPAMGEPPWASTPSIVTSYQACARACVTTPISLPAFSSSAPCSICNSK